MKYKDIMRALKIWAKLETKDLFLFENQFFRSQSECNNFVQKDKQILDIIIYCIQYQDLANNKFGSSFA